jgi:ketosteroid isomerase-like protein
MEPEILTTARDALGRFRAGWATGAWKPFIELLAPGFTMRVPIGELRGRVASRDEAVQHFHLLRLAGVRLVVGEPTRTALGDSTVTFELEVSGSLYQRPYRNRLALSLDVEGGKITSLREYFGDLDPDILREGLGPR